MKIIFVSLFLLFLHMNCTAQSLTQPNKAWNNEPESFAGMKFGDKFQFTECPLEKNVRTKDNLLTIRNRIIPGLEQVCFDTLVSPISDKGYLIYKLNNLPNIEIQFATYAYMKEFALEKIVIVLNAKDFDVMFDLFNEKYGKPTTIERNIAKNYSGTELSNIEAFWVGKNRSIEMHQRLRKIDEWYIEISNNATVAQEAAEKKARVSSAASKL